MTGGNYEGERASLIKKIKAPANQDPSPDIEKLLSQQLEKMSQSS